MLQKTPRVPFFLILFLMGFFLLTFEKGHGEPSKPFLEGPIHESYITRTSDNVILEATPQQPPDPLIERSPRQVDIQAEWIPGYWAWDKNNTDFIWVSGVWRRPPPGHQWIEGYWKKFDAAWAWISGYWSHSPRHHAVYIGLTPPDRIDENVAPPPSNKYFWIPGYWYFVHHSHEYQWVPGRWEELDPHWVLVPPHYVWQPGGYVLIPAYWDWALENRGTAYAASTINLFPRDKVKYEPQVVMKPDKIIENLFPSYPDYLTLFQHHRYFHPDFWKEFCCQPSWWKWETWWCFTFYDQWSLWWWYTHPGFPNPSWLSPEINSILPPPSEQLVSILKSVNPPPFVTPKGVFSPDKLLHVIKKGTAEFTPIVPVNQELLSKMYAHLPDENVREILKPMGHRLPLDPLAVRPSVRKPVATSTPGNEIKRIADNLQPRLPHKPKLSSRSPIKNQNFDSADREMPTYSPPVRRPTWSPRPYQEFFSEANQEQQSLDNGETGPFIKTKPQDIHPVDSKPWRRMKPYEEPSVTRPPVPVPSP